ncbi:MAG: Si-specific NAD(P)(+) transhydrogenase, partial [Anaerolineae bacterium]|nr:Si-specific NAD(P)(+) transhydrogenase [Phycisphaerae bacterium]
MADKYDYELLVIGGGPAGEKGAAQAAYFKHRCAIIERYHELGGACINWGTLASKTLRESALFLSGFRTRQLGEGMEVEFKANVSLANFMARKNLVQQREQKRAADNMDAPWHNIERITGNATIVDPHTVEVTHDGATKRYTAQYILISTGSVPARPKDIPFNDHNIFDSTSILDMKSVPESMVVVGGGVIGSEYACLFAALGVKVYLVHPKPRALDALLDGEIGQEFMERIVEMGIEPCMNDGLESVALEGEQVRCKLKSGRTIVAASLLYALGRSGATGGLGLEKLGIPIGKYGHIEKVDPITYQTAVPNIYAAGDVIGPPALASTSMEQGRLAMCHAFDLKYKTKLAPTLPAGIYTIPEISQVGMTEQDCQKKNIAFISGRSRFGQHARGQIIGDTQGMIKLIFESPSRKLLGVHVIGEMASELVHIGMAVMAFEGGIDYFIHAVFNYPTLSDAYKYAAYDALKEFNKIGA